MQLQAEDISVAIGKKEIVKNVSLQVYKKQFVGIIGANGCGKSTLLKSIYKSIKPKTGSVFLGGIDVLKTTEKTVAQQMSVVGQFNELSFDLTVFEMVLLGRTPHKKMLEGDTKEDIEIARNAIAITKLEEFQDRSYVSLSGGEKQRVILARAIAQQPYFMVLDEPTNHLDIRYQLEILSCVKNLGIGVLAALHDLELAAEYCDYIYVMKAGSVVKHGKPEEVLSEELIEDIYNVNCRIFKNPITQNLGFCFQI